MLVAELRQELHKVNFVSLTVDASNRKEQGHWRAGTLPFALSEGGGKGGGGGFL